MKLELEKQENGEKASRFIIISGMPTTLYPTIIGETATYSFTALSYQDFKNTVRQGIRNGKIFHIFISGDELFNIIRREINAPTIRGHSYIPEDDDTIIIVTTTKPKGIPITIDDVRFYLVTRKYESG
jgi:hypothetical protein